MPAATRLERALLAAVEAGRRLDLGDPGPIDHAEMDGWGTDREIRAEVIRDILVGRAGGQPDPRGLRLRGARIVGPLDLDGIRSDVWFSLHDCDVVEPTRLRGATLPLLDLNGCRIAGLDAENLRVGTVVLLRDGFASTGQISLLGARIGGKLDLYGARLESRTDTALAATGLQVGGSAYLNGGMVVTGHGQFGAIRLVGARIGGMLSLGGAHLRNPDGPALTADNMQVQDMVTMSHGLRAHGAGADGTVRLVAAKISGALSFGDGLLHNDSGPALVAHYLEVSGTLYLDRVQATGLVRIAGGRIGGRVVGSRAVFRNDHGAALDGTRLHAAQGVNLRAATLTGADDVLGAVHLRGARIGGDLDLRDARIGNAGHGPALRISQATVEGEAMVSTLVVERGDLLMRGATLGGLRDDPGRLPPETRLGLDGLTYRGLPGREASAVSAEQRVAWLRRMPEYAAQPYRQLAAAYQAAGHEDDARRILIAQQQHLLDSGRLGGWSRLRQRLLGVTLGYGYESWRAVVGLAATLLTAAVLLMSVDGATARVSGTAGNAGPAQSCAVVERLNLAVDETLPLIDTGVRNRCDLLTTTGRGQAVALATLVLRLLGWAFATLVLAGYTGLVRRN